MPKPKTYTVGSTMCRGVGAGLPVKKIRIREGCEVDHGPKHRRALVDRIHMVNEDLALRGDSRVCWLMVYNFRPDGSLATRRTQVGSNALMGSSLTR